MSVPPRRLVAATIASLAAAALLAATAACSSPAAPDSTPPPVPQITAPTEGQAFSNFPRTVTVTWAGVTDASSNPVTYKLDIQVLAGDGSGTVIEDMNDDNDARGCQGTVTTTSCTFEFPGNNPGRVRIQAIDAKGNASAFSAFVNFKYQV